MIGQALPAYPPAAIAPARKVAAFVPVPGSLPCDRAHGHVDATLTAIAGEARRQLSADCLMIAVHERGVSRTLAVSGDPDVHDMQEMCRCSAHATLAAAAQNTWFTSQSDLGEILTTPIAVAHGRVTVTAHYRRPAASSQVDVREAAASLLSILAPFFCLWSDRVHLERRSRGLSAALDKSDIGVMLVDRHARIVFANSIATTALAEGGSIRQVGDALTAKNLADTLRLQAAVDHVISSGGSRGRKAGEASPVLAIARHKRRALMAAVVAYDDTDGSDDGLAIIYLFDPEVDLQLCLEPVCKLYGLSPVEAKLTCLLADGMSLGDAAERMHVRELTARSYLKQVFLKTDTKRQAELVWLMLKSTVRTAAGCPIGLV